MVIYKVGAFFLENFFFLHLSRRIFFRYLTNFVSVSGLVFRTSHIEILSDLLQFFPLAVVIPVKIRSQIVSKVNLSRDIT